MVEKHQTAGIILAAGMSKRFKKPKQLLKIDGTLMIERVLDAAIDSKLSMIYLVLGHESKKILDSIKDQFFNDRIEIVINPEYQYGMSTSLLAGLSRAKNRFQSVMFLLGDQPLIKPQTINSLLNHFHASNKSICVPVYKKQRGHPVIFHKNAYPLIAGIKGDTGARQIILDHPEMVVSVELDNPSCIVDIDEIADLSKISALL